MLSAVKLKILTQTVVRSLLGDAIPEDKVKKSFGVVADAENDGGAADPMKSAFACLRFLLVNATRYGADEAVFNEELQQLGLPKEHSAAICRVRGEYLTDIAAMLAKSSLSVNQLTDFSYTLPAASETIDCATLHVRIANELRNGRPQATGHSVHISRSDIAYLLDELRTIDRIMGETAPETKQNEVEESSR